MSNIIIYASLVIYLAYFAKKVRKDIHMLQLNSYMNGRYFKWITGNKHYFSLLKDLLPLIALIFVKNPWIWGLIWLVVYSILFVSMRKSIEKKKLVFTNRVIRLIVTISILVLAFLVIIIFNQLLVSPGYQAASLIMLVLAGTLSPFVVMVANLINLPIENLINQWYYNDAKSKLKLMPNLKIIGITGSYGKTSTKYILTKILSEKFNTLMTPESYNTTMGVIKTIRTMLKPFHEVFVVEMGAKKRGDIKEICDLVSPGYGLLTSIGEQHLETFINIENIIRTKFELIDSLPENGIAFLNYDNDHIRGKAVSKKTIRYGIDGDNLHYWAEKISFHSKGSSFLVCKYSGEKAILQTKLLGTHNILNIVAAVSVASELGVDFDSIAYAVKAIEPVPHRLELKKNPGGITVIDDAFNSNPVGAKMALQVLKTFESQNKILITPGMVELGGREFECNKEFGIEAAAICDYIILVGPQRTLPIQEGLKERNYPQEKLMIASNLNEALERMRIVAKEGSVVLFENDLPDTYNE